MGQHICFGVYSDPHSGGTPAQDTSINTVLYEFIEERGIRLFLDPGDVYCGIYIQNPKPPERKAVNDETKEEANKDGKAKG